MFGYASAAFLVLFILPAVGSRLWPLSEESQRIENDFRWMLSRCHQLPDFIATINPQYLNDWGRLDSVCGAKKMNLLLVRGSQK